MGSEAGGRAKCDAVTKRLVRMAKNRARALREFLARQPLCIFCGGIRPATTRDHVPSRQAFHNREWPEGYEFPSCEACNRATKDAEQVIAFLSRMYPEPINQAERLEMKRIIRAVGNNHPDVLREMLPPKELLDEHSRKPWVQQMRLAGHNTHPLRLDGPELRAHLEVFSRKLFSALHYKEFSKIIPPDGGIIWSLHSNVQRIEGQLPNELITMMSARPSIQRTRRPLTDQFAYTFVKAEDAELTAYFAMFRHSFAVLGFVDMDADRMVDGNQDMVPLRPLSWVTPGCAASSTPPRAH